MCSVSSSEKPKLSSRLGIKFNSTENLSSTIENSVLRRDIQGQMRRPSHAFMDMKSFSIF
jgi:hypothetical protein